MPGSELEERTQALWRYHRDRHLAENGPPDTERAGEGGDDPLPIPDLPMPEELTKLATVGIIFDEAEGLCYVPDYGAAREVFANPHLIEDEHYRDIVLGYLGSEGIMPWVLRRLAWRDPERASQVFRRLLNIPGFSWESDGEAPLRIYKPDTVDLVPTPAVVTPNRKLSESSREAQAEPPARARTPAPGRPGRNDPCPCGSGREYKRCCGR